MKVTNKELKIEALRIARDIMCSLPGWTTATSVRTSGKPNIVEEAQKIYEWLEK